MTKNKNKMKRQITINNEVTDLYFGKILSKRQLKVLEILTIQQFELPVNLRMSAEKLVLKAKNL